MDVFVVGSQAMQAIGACDAPSKLAFVQPNQLLVSCGGQSPEPTFMAWDALLQP